MKLTSIFRTHTLFLALLFSLIQCSGKNDEEVERVNAVLYKLIEADNNANIETIVSLYTDSIEFYPTGREFTKGIENVRQNYQNLFKDYTLAIATQITDTRVFANSAMVTGVNKGIKTSKSDGSISTLDDQYIAILLKNNGEWKIDKLIWSASRNIGRD